MQNIIKKLNKKNMANISNIENKTEILDKLLKIGLEACKKKTWKFFKKWLCKTKKWNL